jgi:hypothetical protein
MATARELLEQANAFMRRNRENESDPEIPELTDVVSTDDSIADDDSVADFGGASAAPIVVSATPAQDAIVDAASAETDTIPVLTEVIADLDPFLPPEMGAAAVAPSRWSEDVLGDDGAIAFPGEASLMPLPPLPAAVMPAPPFIANDDRERDAARWEHVAEDVRMQVLQRIDIFTDTGLHEQLKERLQPIVDRASADLVATINREVGQLLRAYVAEAIEREIDKWRQSGG